MIPFSKKQEIFEVGKVRMGGQLGELPTVLIGSIFHHGHRVVEDEATGEFDRVRAEDLVRSQDELSRETGNPCMVDVVGRTSETLIKYIDFVAEVTDAPLLINGPSAEVRLSASRHAVSVGLKDRAVYNSINFTVTTNEINAVRALGMKTAIVQALDPHSPLPKSMVDILRGERGLIEAARGAGIAQILILTPVIDIPHVGCSASGIRLIKEEFGLPTGSAPVGVLSKWARADEFGGDTLRLCRPVPAVICQVMGANFIIYGSLAKAREVFPPCALADVMIAYNSRFTCVKVSKEHPLNKIFRSS